MGVGGGAVVTRKRMFNAGGKADTHNPRPALWNTMGRLAPSAHTHRDTV